MIFGYDGKRAVLNNTGLGNYSRLLVEVMSRFYPDNSYRLYTPEVKPNPRLEEVLEHDNVSLVTPDEKYITRWKPFWRSLNMASQMVDEGVGLIHGLSGELPVNVASAGVPSVVTIHDVIFRYYPECYPLVDRKIYDYKFRKSVHAATRVLAISECTARDVEKFYGVDPDKIDVVYQGCHAQFRRDVSADEIAQVRRKYGIERPYIICVGTVEARKNQMMAVRGLRGLPDEFDLVIVGRRTPSYARTIDSYLNTYNTTDRIKFIDYADFADLPALYAGAFCSSYTSLYEGFGIPVIESLSVGTPVIVASGSCLEEAAGPSAPVVSPGDIGEWISLVKELFNYPEARRRIAAEGRQYVSRFSDEAMARGTMECYRKAIEDYERQKK